MNHKKLFFILTSIVTLVSLVIPVAIGNGSSSQVALAQKLRQETGAEITWNPLTGKAGFVRGAISLQSMRLPSGAGPQDRALTFIRQYANLFGVQEPDDELALDGVVVDSFGQTHVTFRQVFQGVEVYGGEMKIHLSADQSMVTAASSSYIPAIKLDAVQAKISAAQAGADARDYLPAGVEAAAARLVVYPGQGEAPGSAARLAWLIELKDDLKPARNLYVVDAQNGKVIDIRRRLYDEIGAVNSQSQAPLPSGWKTYTDEKLGVEVAYPGDWQLTLHSMSGRHRGFDPILLTSFIPSAEAIGRPLSIPTGEAALLINFEGNDLRAGQSLSDYAWESLASIEYRLTGQTLELGSQRYIEMSGERGVLWVTSYGANVYSVFAHPGNSPAQLAVVEKILAYLAPIQSQSILIPAQDLGRKAPGRILAAPASESPAVVIPAMKLPWDDADHTYTSGPHGPPIAWDCAALRNVTAMSALDFGMEVGTPVLASAGGRIVRAEYVSGYGGVVGIDHGGDFGTEYWHLSTITDTIALFRTVSQGRVLGDSGTAGSGPHLHLDFRNMPGNTPYTAHGMSIDGYQSWAIIRQSDELGFNYQGTLTQGGYSTDTVTWCTTPANQWNDTDTGSTVIAGDDKTVASTNLSCPNGQFRAEYYNNTALSGQPVFVRCEAAPIAYDWGAEGPGNGVNNDKFSVRWAGLFDFNEGTYATFAARTDDGMRVFVEGESVLDEWHDQSATAYRGMKTLAPGRYEVKVEYYENYGSAVAQLSWSEGRERKTYNANNGYTLPGILARAEDDPATGDVDIDNAHDFAGATHDYFFNAFGRKSFDDLGAELRSTANYGRAYMNAFWNGEQTTYGDSFAVKDVVAHEWTHAVIQYTANLEYQWQSGALNESFADIFGAMIDRDDWLMGEELPDSVLGGREAIRDLADPTRFGQPAHTNDWVETCSDEEGVHTNSGITNKAFYNIATSIGKEKAEQVFYRALVFYLGQNSTLEQARAAALSAVTDLHGADSPEYTAVEDGFNAVGLDGVWNPPANDCVCAASVALTGETDGVTLLTDLRSLRDNIFTVNPGLRWKQAYYDHQFELAWLLLTNSELRADALAGLRMAAPGVSAVLDGDGGETEVLTLEMIQSAEETVKAIAAESSPATSDRILAEWEQAAPYRFVGWEVHDAWEQLRREEMPQIFLPLISR
ncbi:MAG: M4 family metallopeptidase [Chloroflexi bacterium]|nr:M4 family metallopeptidase [Chloroflexota bacterium]